MGTLWHQASIAFQGYCKKSRSYHSYGTRMKGNDKPQSTAVLDGAAGMHTSVPWAVCMCMCLYRCMCILLQPWETLPTHDAVVPLTCGYVSYLRLNLK